MSSHTKEQAARIVDKAAMAQAGWAEISFADRAGYVKTLALALRDNINEYAGLITSEMGKPIKESIAEIEKCALVCEYYAQNAEGFLKNEEVKTEAAKSYVAYNPLGVVLAVMPWNFPFWQVFRCAAPILMAGNNIVLKHASNVPESAKAIEEIFRKAGFPDDIFRTLLIGSEDVEAIIAHDAVRAVTFTGSVEAGRKVAMAAGANLKKSLLELGGSDAYIVLKDADIKQAAKICMDSRMINCGQSCVAAKRFIVEAEVYDEFITHATARLKEYVMGNPLDEKTTMGPMSSVRLRDQLHEQVTQSVEKGAKILMGGFIPKMEGAYYPATLLVNIERGMAAYEEEMFGPVASVIKVSNEDEAIRIANDSSFGLGSAIFSKDIEKAEKTAATKIKSGMCFVNSSVKSDPRLPFGGIKNSGYGRELSHFGIREFVNAKTVWVD